MISFVSIKVPPAQIVHPTLWVRSVTALMKAIVSEKVWRKIVTISQLSKLNEYIPLSRFRETIPQQIFDTDNETNQTNRSSGASSVSELPPYPHIGLSTEALKRRDGGALVLFNACLKFLTQYGPGTEGVFRINPDRSKMFSILDGLEKANIGEGAAYQVHRKLGGEIYFRVQTKGNASNRHFH